VIENRMRVKNGESMGYLYHGGLITKSLSDDFKKKGYLKNIHLPLKIRNEEEIKEENEELKKEDEYELREYQEEAMEALRGEWDGVQLLNLPCGTGKTLIIGNHCKEKRYKKVFIFSPTRVLTKQNMKRMKRFLEDYEDILVDCDDEGTRNIDDIEKIMLDEEEKYYIISSTYTSAKDVIRELFNEEDEEDDDEYECKYDLSDSILIVDEAHNLINLDNLIKVVRSFPKVILMTATPPQEMEEEIGCCTIYNYSLKRGIEEGYICDYEIYLPMLIKKEIGAGQEEKEEYEIESVEIPDELEGLDKDMTSKVLFLINGMLKTGSKRCIVYMSRVEECNEFEIVMKEVMTKYHKLEYSINQVSSFINYKGRELALNDFKKDDNMIKIITSIKILDEGIDLPICDCIYIDNINERSNHIRMIQRICRANRLDPNNKNKKAKAFVWNDHLNRLNKLLDVFYETNLLSDKIHFINGDYENNNSKEVFDKNKILKDYFITNRINYMASKRDTWENNFNKVLDYIKIHNKRPSCKDKDKYIKRMGTWILTNNYDYKKKQGFMSKSKYYELWKNFLDMNKTIIESHKIKWIRNFEKVKEFIKKNNKRPSRYATDIEEKKLYQWLMSNLTLYRKNNKIIDDEITKLFSDFFREHQSKFNNYENKYIYKLLFLELFLNINKRLPDKEKNTYERKLDLFIKIIRQNYRLKKESMGKENIRKIWENIYNKYIIFFKDIKIDTKEKKTKEQNDNNNIEKYFKFFDEMLDKAINYIEKNGKKPSIDDIDKDISNIGEWLHKVNNQYYHNRTIMNKESIDKWIKFKIKYKNVFLISFILWDENYKKVVKYYNEHGKRPSIYSKEVEIKKLGRWIQHQHENYKKEEGPLKDENYRKIWEEFKKKYP
jgi:superfamily II DNA or RNA helicase